MRTPRTTYSTKFSQLSAEEQVARRKEQRRKAAKTFYRKHTAKCKATTSACDRARKVRDPEVYRAKTRLYSEQYRRRKGIRDKQANKLPPEEVRRRAYVAHERWRQENPDLAKELSRKSNQKRRLEQPEHIRAVEKVWRKANPDKIRAKNKKTKHERNRKLGPLDTAAWQETIEVFNNQCAYCLAPANSLDHIVPAKHGGTNASENCVPCCMACNTRKNAKSLLNWLFSSTYAQDILPKAM